jgi:hypothetical protein
MVEAAAGVGDAWLGGGSWLVSLLAEQYEAHCKAYEVCVTRGSESPACQFAACQFVVLILILLMFKPAPPAGWPEVFLFSLKVIGDVWQQCFC